MKVSNLHINSDKTKTTFSADFIFHKPFVLDAKRDQSRFYWDGFLNILKRPYSIFDRSYLHKHSVWFQVPNEYAYAQSFRDVFFMIGLIMALRQGESLVFEGAVSQSVVKKAKSLELFYRFEHPKRKIRFHVQSVEKNSSKGRNHKLGQFFTLGVDSFFTLLTYPRKKNQPQWPLIFVDGYDIPLNQTKFLEDVHVKTNTLAKRLSGKAIYVQSNVRTVSDRVINWPQFHIAAIAGVGTLLDFKHLLINGESFDWPDWGLRYGVDKLYSTPTQTYELVGHNRSRDVKIAGMLNHPLFDTCLEFMRVCWVNIAHKTVAYNCSKCQKCIRTILTLQAFDIHNPPTFKKVDLEALRKLEIVGHVRHEWTVVYEMLSKRSDTDPKLLEAIEHVLRKPTRV